MSASGRAYWRPRQLPAPSWAAPMPSTKRPGNASPTDRAAAAIWSGSWYQMLTMLVPTTSRVVSPGQTVRVKTETGRARGQVVQAGERAVKIAANGEPVDIPYEAIVRANLIDEGNQA